MAGDSKDPKQRRTRLQLSCQPCRIGKLKCNRELPCEQCSKRSRETSCTYTSGAQESISFKTQAKAMRDKLENLERAVQHFKEADQRRAEESGQLGLRSDISSMSMACDTPASSDVATPISSISYSSLMTPGHLISSNEEGNTYIGPSHWQSIINDISEVKAYFDYEGSQEGNLTSSEENHAKSSPAPSTTTPDLFLRVSPAMSKEQLIYAIPPKNVADRLVQTFFHSMDIYKPVIHVPSFQKQYRQFWEQPQAVPTAWLGLLFVIFALGLQYTFQSTQSDKEAAYDSNTYLELAAHAIVLADYTKPKAYTIEGLILYIRCCQMQDSERQFKDWLVLGLVSRLCIRMGYHRDPAHYPEINAFDGEMRRRVWMFVCFMDVTMSYAIGLISNITNVHHNVRLPRNLNDSDFGPSSRELPQSRPDTEHTLISHMQHAGMILPLFAESVRLSHSPSAPALQNVHAIATRLHQVAEKIPAPLMVLPLDQAFADHPETIFKRYGLEVLIQKARCVLLRRYLGSSEYKERKACVESALRCLEIQKALEDARLPGGPLNGSPAQQMWDLFDAFLLAGLVIAVELSAVQRATSAQETSAYSEMELQAMEHALQTSCSLWQASPIASEKAKRAAKALEKILQPRLTPHGLSGGQEYAGAGLLDPGQAHAAEVQSQWLKAAENSMHAFDVNSLAAGGIAPYPPVTSSPPLPMDYSMQDQMNLDWVSSRLPYFQ